MTNKEIKVGSYVKLKTERLHDVLKDRVWGTKSKPNIHKIIFTTKTGFDINLDIQYPYESNCVFRGYWSKSCFEVVSYELTEETVKEVL